VSVGPSSESRVSLHRRGRGMQLSSVCWPLVRTGLVYTAEVGEHNGALPKNGSSLLSLYFIDQLLMTNNLTRLGAIGHSYALWVV